MTERTFHRVPARTSPHHVPGPGNMIAALKALCEWAAIALIGLAFWAAWTVVP